MKRIGVISTCIFLLSIFSASNASASYITFENVWGSSINFVNMGFWDVPHTVEIGELWSSDYGIKPPNAFLLDITQAHPLLPGQIYTTALIPWLPDTGFLFTGLGVGGGFGFTANTDVAPGHTFIIPGSSSSVIYALWPTDGPGIPCNACGTGTPVLEITFHEGKPKKNMAEPSSFLLLGTGLAGLGFFGRVRARFCRSQPLA